MPTQKQRKSCRNKKKYDSNHTAQSRASYLHTKGLYLRPYECPVCKGWHLAKRNKLSVMADLFKRIEKERSSS